MNGAPLSTWWGVRCVWLRYFDVFRKNMLYGMVTTFVEPILYLTSFGFGMGSIIGNVTSDGRPLSYRAFVLAGIVGQAVLFQGFFEAAYGGFIRMYYQRIFKAMATTPVTLSEVLWGELLWDATKGTLSSTTVLLIGAVIGDFRPEGALLAIPLCFVSAFLFGALGLWVAAASQTIEQISYPQYLLIFPMFLFCGIYFPIENLPSALHFVAWCLPVTSVLSIVRALVLGTTFQWKAVLILAAWLAVLVPWARRKMMDRLVK